MSRASVLARGRRAAAAGFVDTCTITRAGEGTGDFDEETGEYDTPARVSVYSGPCRIQIKSVVAASSTSAAPERLVTSQDFELQLPVVGSESVAIGDLAKVTAAVNDTALVDREFTVVARHEKSDATARRLRVSEVTG